MPKLIPGATELLDLLAPQAGRRDEARRLLDFCLDPDLIDQSKKMSNPKAGPGTVAREARRVAARASEMLSLLGEFRRDRIALINSLKGFQMALASFSTPFPSTEKLGIIEELLPSAAIEATAVAERLAKLESRGAPQVWIVRHLVVMNLLSLFRRFHVSQRPNNHLRWKAERNKFLRAALAACAMPCDRRTLEQHLRKIGDDAASVVTGAVT